MSTSLHQASSFDQSDRDIGMPWLKSLSGESGSFIRSVVSQKAAANYAADGGSGEHGRFPPIGCSIYDRQFCSSA
jgi:hypothetical protein